MRKFLGLSVITGMFCMLPACSSCSKQQAEPKPAPAAQIDSGFNFLTDAFVFENFGGNAIGTQLNARLLERMFGTSAVCLEEIQPCELTPVAQAWMNSTNATLDTGRSEGFSALALLFHKDVLNPSDFGADTVAELKLYDNALLQEEFAYWAATQAVPSAMTSTERYAARDVLPFLEKALAPDSEGAWRLAVAQKTDKGFQRGHAMVPIGYYRGEGGVYWLRVYDNNVPSREQLLEINPEANTWRYVITGLLGEEIVYEGNADNGNYLYFSNVLERTDVLQAPFSPDSKAYTVVTQGMTAVVEFEGGDQTGIVDGKVVESGDDRVIPAFSSCPRCGPTVNILNQALIDNGIRSYEQIQVKSSGDIDTSVTTDSSQVDRRAKSVTATRNGYSATVTPTGSTEDDSVSFGNNSAVYTSESGEPFTVEVTVEGRSGNTHTVRVTVDPGEGDDRAEVEVRVDENGQSSVAVKGNAGSTVSVESDFTNKGGAKTTSTSKFKTNTRGQTTVGTKPGEETSDSPTPLEVDGDVSLFDESICSNNQIDVTFETDVDCGGLCGTCRHQERCKEDSDCAGTCGTDLKCSTPHCTDGTKNQDETDVDCGGMECLACTAANDSSAQACVEHGDCDSNSCVSGLCRIPKPVTVRIFRKIDGLTSPFRIDYRLDSGELQSTVIDNPHLLGYPLDITLGNAYNYSIEFAGVCRALFGVVNNVVDTPRVTLDCPGPFENYLILTPGSTFQTADDDPIKLRLTLNGNVSEIEYTNDTSRYLGSVSQDWEIRPIEQPKQNVYGGENGEQGMLYLECNVSPESSSVSNDVTFSSTARMFCTPQMNVPSCSDNKRNQNETDVDCGGVCEPCAQNEGCNTTQDCDTHACVGFTCSGDLLDTCNDGRQNYFETDVDCGAIVDGDRRCDPCDVGQACFVDRNCALGTGQCVNNVCVEVSCDDGVKNGDEGDIDCGGLFCGGQLCANGRTCNENRDCSGNFCNNGICEGASCDDGIQNLDESDIDCGGITGTCDRCAGGKRCTGPMDCISGECTNNVCENACSDNVKNQDETDIDCGGSLCGVCAGGRACMDNADCASNVCTNNVCEASAGCSDNVKNQDETAVDCGGSICGGCADGLVCNNNSDCANNYCTTADVCATPTCSDTITNGDETDQDCGGNLCAPCSGGQVCSVNTDCSSNVCLANNTCQASATCSDNIQNQDETAIDCGGSTCGGCADGLACGGDSDCANGFCVGNVCVTPTCSDGIQNQGETAVDCGGPNCAGCMAGSACTIDSECGGNSCECGASSGNCAGDSGLCSAGQFFIDQPVTDGTTASGTYVIPAGCTQMYVQAWGAAGASASSFGGVGMQGGGGGYVDGTINVTPGDTATVWLGQGGSFDNGPGGAGSYLGTSAAGGASGFTMTFDAPGGGGGLTSVQIAGTTPYSFSIPAGAGADIPGQGFVTEVTTTAGGGAVGYAGVAGADEQGGGGAGDPGGLENTPGAYGLLPMGLTAYDASAENPAGTMNEDYSRCLGSEQIPAGSSDAGAGAGGDGCVVLRCVGQ